MNMLKRPRKDEDEEDLLQLQKDFLTQKQKSSAQATRSKNDRSADEPSIADNHDIPENIEIKVIERDTSNCKARPPSRVTANKSAFPKTFKLNRGICKSANASLFAQSVGLKSKESVASIHTQTFSSSKLLTGSSLGKEGQNELQMLHSENCQKLASMTPEEIEEERKQILNKLSPEMINFIRAGKLKNNGTSNVETPSSSASCSHGTQETIDTDSLPISTNEVKKFKWLNMNKIEKDKLEWLKPIASFKRTEGENEDILNQLGIKDARFDLQGNIIADDKQKSLTGKEGLHHHGEEPERGGYTITELLTLLESSFASQKVIALSLLGRIMEKCSRGLFDHLLEMSCLSEQLLECTPILLMVRKLLDDTSASVSTSALACLKQIICNLELDELYLDRLFPWFFGSTTTYPRHLDPDYKGEADTPLQEMADDDYIKKDPVPALIRTDLLTRLAYLLENQVKSQDDPLVVKNLFSILIRVARHSFNSCQSIINTPFLLQHIINYFFQPSFVSLDTFYGNPYSKAVKLIRILCQSGANAVKVYQMFGDQIVTSCLAYLALDPLSIEETPRAKKKSSDFMQLVQEAIKLLVVLTDHHLSLDPLQAVSPLLVPQVQYFFTLDIVSMASCEKQFDWQFASSLILLIRNLCKARGELTPIYYDIVQGITHRWIQSVIQMNVLPVSVDASSALRSGVLFLHQIPHPSPRSFATFTQGNSLSLVCATLEKILSSFCHQSCIINGKEGDEVMLRRSCSIHPEYRSLLESSCKVHPSLADDCVLPLIQSLVISVKSMNDPQLTKKFLCTDGMQQLLMEMSQSTKVIDSYFSQFEVEIVKEILFLAPSVLSGDEDGEICRIYLMVALRLVPMIQPVAEKKIFMEKVVFNPKLYCNQLPRLLQTSLSVSGTQKQSSVIEVLENALLIYCNLSPLSTEFWIFDPILYVSKVVQSVSSEETDFQEAIEAVLAFIQLLLDSAAGYFDFSQSGGNKFSAVSLIFLMTIYLTGSKYFLNDKIKSHIRTALQVYLVDETSVDRNFLTSAKSPVPAQLIYGKDCRRAFPKMAQYFERILQEYAAESYSDPLFTSFILLFLRSNDQVKGSISLRSVFFSEAQSELLESMFTRIEDFDANLLIQLLHPHESDVVVIELFIKCLLSRCVTQAKNPVCYWMLVYHVHNLLYKNTDGGVDQQKKTALVNSIKALDDEVLKNHLISFKIDPVYSSQVSRK